jgi:putative tryptophan/tyrosine transport system substrate-binding protein
VDRRLFLLTSLAGALAVPLAAEGQQGGRVPRLGYLANSSAESPADSAFLHGLRDLGWVVGRTILVDARYVGARSEQIPEVARDLVSRGVNVIATWSPKAVVAVRQATATIPIVGMSMGDPVALGVAASFARPGGNVTGVADLQEALQAKRVEILKETIPGIRRLAVLANPNQPSTVEYVKHVNVATRAFGLQVELLNVSSPNELDGAFAGISRRRADALLVLPDGMFWAVRADIVGLAARQRVPAIYWERAYAEVGGLLSYAASLIDIGRRVATLVDRILKGAKPADLPVEQPTKFELVINLKTAKALGLTIPPYTPDRPES